MTRSARSPKPLRPLRDDDVTERTFRIMWLAFVAIAVLAVVFAPPQLAVLMIAVPIVLPIVRLVSARVARTVYDPSGATVPSRPAYSAAESLAVRGRFEEAIQAYEAASFDEPADPAPWFRIARIERNDLKRPQRAIEALRAARTRVPTDSPAAVMAGKEIAEIYLRDLDDPTRAMPELARLAASFPDTPTGTWAKRELMELKSMLGVRGDSGAVGRAEREDGRRVQPDVTDDHGHDHDSRGFVG